jgi:ABC-2 type transport system permease protein
LTLYPLTTLYHDDARSTTERGFTFVVEALVPVKLDNAQARIVETIADIEDALDGFVQTPLALPLQFQESVLLDRPDGIAAMAAQVLFGTRYRRSRSEDPGLTTEVALLVTFLLGVLAMTGIGAGSDLTRVLVLLACYLAYYIAWLGLTLTISAFAKTGRVALAGSLGVWMLVSVLTPRLMTDVVRTMHPTPSAAAFAAAMKRDMDGGVDGHGGAAERDQLFRSAVLKKYGVDSLSQLPVSFAGLSLEEGERHGNEVFDKHYAALWNTFAQQERVREVSAIASPVLAMRALSMALSGTDVAQHVHFQTAAEQYRRQLMTAMNGEITTKAKGTDFEYRADSSTWAKVPPFTYEAPAVRWVLQRHVPAMLLLGVWASGMVLLTWWSIRRMAP